MQIVDFGYMQRDVTLIFDHDHKLIILFLISLRIWSIGVDVKLTQQDVKNPRLQVPRLVPLLLPWSAGSRHPGAWERSPRAGRAGPSVCLPRVDHVFGT